MLDVQIVVHDRDVQADVVHAVWRDVKDDGLIVGWIQGVLFYARFLLFQTPPVTYERHFDVGICRKTRGTKKNENRKSDEDQPQVIILRETLQFSV